MNNWTTCDVKETTVETLQRKRMEAHNTCLYTAERLKECYPKAKVEVSETSFNEIPTFQFSVRFNAGLTWKRYFDIYILTAIISKEAFAEILIDSLKGDLKEECEEIQ